jgi:superfamily II DNA/RNA helicase
MEKLLEFQKPHVESLVASLMLNSRVLDASDTGTGKTFCILVACIIGDFIPFVICPKSVISNWYDVAEKVGCELYGVSNYELLQNCSYWNSKRIKSKAKFIKVQEIDSNKKADTDSDSDSDTKIKRKFIKSKTSHKEFQKKFRERALLSAMKNKPIEDSDLVASDTDSGTDTDTKSKKEKICYDFLWDLSLLPPNILFIFDEAHKCKNHKTNNGRILYKLAQNFSARIALLSATVVDKPEFFKLPGYVLKLYPSVRGYKGWLERLIKSAGPDFNTQSNPMGLVHSQIYPDYASRMRILELGDKFPTNHIIAEKLDMENAVEIQAQYKLIQEAVEAIKRKEIGAMNPLTIILYARQQIELLKIPVFVRLANELVSQGKHVAIFVNFTDTLVSLGEHLKTTCWIYGEQSLNERDANIKAFVSNKEKIILCNIRAGGVGISLHDTDGAYPRVALISPTWSAQDLIQVLGRVHRANCKSPVEQKILFCNGTFEETIAEIIQTKVANIGFLNDGSVESYQMENLIESSQDQNFNQQFTINKIKTSEFEDEFERLNRLYKKKTQLEEDLKQIIKEIADSEKKLGEKIF